MQMFFFLHGICFFTHIFFLSRIIALCIAVQFVLNLQTHHLSDLFIYAQHAQHKSQTWTHERTIFQTCTHTHTFVLLRKEAADKQGVQWTRKCRTCNLTRFYLVFCFVWVSLSRGSRLFGLVTVQSLTIKHKYLVLI